ncbi:MAG: signal peptidase II [Alphaproteobacteria bacterium]|nr:MAG: signal peptidase II [Alphaproteobacteria bacterium]
MRALALTALATLAADQGSKLVVVQLLDLKTRGHIEVLPPLLQFRMAWNRGVNFGLGASGSDLARWLFIAFALAIAAWVVWWIWREGGTRRTQVFGGLLVGGALGNVIDRLVHGAVADFLNMSCCGISNPWSFNLADVAIFAGALGLALFAGAGKSAQ